MTKRLALLFRADTPPQWKKFIEKYPMQHDCPFPAERVILTGIRWRLMCAIQREVNLSIRYRRDPKGSDRWRILLNEWGAFGDCEDYALTKRALLIEAGLPMGAVWPALCLKASRRVSSSITRGEGHMVTVVSTVEKDFVMDFAPSWIHDITTSLLDWKAIYDGQQWRLVSLSGS
jgi:predicted transglutaminase-like cysteine proteinase